MHQFGGYQSGRTFLIERVKLLRLLRRMARGDYQWELARRTKLVAEIERTKKTAARPPGQDRGAGGSG